MPPHYRARNFKAYPCAPNQQMAFLPYDQSVCPLPTALSQMLDACDSFATLEEHAHKLTEKFKLQHSQTIGIQRDLEKALEAGFLVSDAELFDTCRIRSADGSQEPSISAVGLVTANRTDSLQSALRSYAENIQKHGRSVTFVVADNSLLESTQKENKTALTSIGAEFHLPVSYLGDREKNDLIATLEKQTQVARPVLEFALQDSEEAGYAPGINRNALLLHLAGKRFLSVDDDTICRPARVASQPGLCLANEVDPTEMRFFQTADDLMKGIVTADQDVLGDHERLLGRSVAALVARRNLEQVDWNGMSASLLGHIWDGRARVRTTWSGYYGDHGSSSTSGYLFMEGNSRRELMQSEAFFRSAVESRQMLRTVSKATISEGAYFQSMMVGLANDDLLPPFMPIYRAQDTLFGSLLKACGVGDYLGYVPGALEHRPVETRRADPNKMSHDAERITFQMLISQCLRIAKPSLPAGTFEARLIALGGRLVEVGQLSLSEFHEWARSEAWERAGQMVQLAENRLKKFHQTPTFWVKEVEHYLSTLAEAMTQPLYCVPMEVLPTTDASPDEVKLAQEKTQRIIVRFGELLKAWPTLWKAAARLSRD